MHDTIPLGSAPAPAEGDLPVPRPPGVIRRFWARHPRLTDSIIAGLYLIINLIEVTVRATMDGRPVWAVLIGIGALGGAATALLFRRRRPYTALFAMWAVTLILAPVSGELDPVSIPLALYAVAVYRSTRDAWIGFAGSLLVGTVGAALVACFGRMATIAPYGAAIPVASSQFGILMLLATLIGITVGNRKRYVAALLARAEQLAKDRDQQAVISAAAERARIAREMHDIVSHSLTVMVTLADGAAAIVDSEPARASHALSRLAETGRTALTDMRRMLGVLGSSQEAQLAPQPGTGDLESLLETYRAAGLRVSLITSGLAPADPAAQLVQFRIVQESLTNVLRHADSPTEVRVSMRHEPDSTTIEVVNDGRVAGPSGGGGHGLVGMRERVVLYGGTLDAAPLAAGGWRVLAVLPRESEDSELDEGSV